MRVIVQLTVMIVLISILIQLPISIVLLRFSNGTVFPAFERPAEALSIMVRIVQGGGPLWYKAANMSLTFVNLLVLIGTAAYPAHLLGRRKSDDRRCAPHSE